MITIRRAVPEDVDFLVELYNDPETRPFLAQRRAFDRAELTEQLALQDEDPDAHGTFVIEVDGELAGAMQFRRTNERHRTAHLGGLAVHPRFRGRRVADDAARQFQRHLIFDLGYHRLEMVVYGFNERSMVHAERAGWTKEGVKRKAYQHDGEWIDGVMYSVIREDFD